MRVEDLKKLRAWFAKNAASLPWRPRDLNELRDPYAVWISETMLQQTQVSTVRDYFVRWMKRFPTVEELAKAEEAEVFQYWQGLGYYSRARNILKTARILADKVKVAVASTQILPDNRMDLEKLPGIGAYTAGAILSLSYHKREAILDGNLVRIFSRYHELDFLPGDRKSTQEALLGNDEGKEVSANQIRENQREKNKRLANPKEDATAKSCTEIYWDYAREVADSPKAYMHNEALMELGRRICKTRNPDCMQCPLKGGCHAFAHGRVSEFPPPKTRVQQDWHGTALVVESADGKYLAVTAHCPFLTGQLALPHFESAKNATAGLPSAAESFVNADEVISIQDCGTFRHNITIHKIQCNVLHIKCKSKAQQLTPPIFSSLENIQGKTECNEFSWIPRESAHSIFANSFSLKALKKSES